MSLRMKFSLSSPERVFSFSLSSSLRPENFILPASAAPVIERSSNAKKSDAFAPLPETTSCKSLLLPEASFITRELSFKEPSAEPLLNFQSAYTRGAACASPSSACAENAGIAINAVPAHIIADANTASMRLISLLFCCIFCFLLFADFFLFSHSLYTVRE